MKDKKNKKDGKTFYIKNLPNAEFFITYARFVYKYLYSKGAKKISSKKYSIPKIYCGCTLSEKDFIDEIRYRFESLKDCFIWHSQYDKIEDRDSRYVKFNERHSEWNSEKGCELYSIYYDCDNIDESDSEREVEDIYMKNRVEESKYYKEMIEKYNK